MPLRVAEITIQGFRTFQGPTTIRLGDEGGADAIATFHGDNGAGKSNAIAALRAFFELAELWLSWPRRQATEACRSAGAEDLVVAWDRSIVWPSASRPVIVSSREFNVTPQRPAELVAQFAEDELGSARLSLTASGNQVLLRLRWPRQFSEAPNPHLVNSDGRRPELDQALTRLMTPRGPGSQPLAVLGARRQLSWLPVEAMPSLLHPGLAEQLLALRTSLQPRQRERWRAFVALLTEFPTLRGREVTIERLKEGSAPVLVLEDRGRSVLQLDELSSGEQQLIVLCATILLADAEIVVIEEPELSLDVKNQQLLRHILQRQIDAGLVSQFILESHVPTFDGPRVVRFRRGDNGATEVSREPGVSEQTQAVATQAKAQGAEQRWVTKDGYTQLPEQLRDELGVGAGAHVWFLKNQGRWQAWPEQELESLLSAEGQEDQVDASDNEGGGTGG